MNVTNATQRRTGGWLLTEMLVGMALIAMVIGALAAVRYRSRQLHAMHLLKQQCVSAVQAQLDTIAATGEVLPAADVRRLWPDVTVAIERTDGEGDWAGLTRVNAVATGQCDQRTVRVELGRYVAGKGGR